VYAGRVVVLAERLPVGLCPSLTACRSRVFEGAGGRSLLLLLVLLLLLPLLGVSFAAGAAAQTSCSYASATSLLTVKARTDPLGEDVLAEIKRKGSEIVVGEYLEPPTHCSGGVPTVLNTDTIRVLARGGADVDLRLGAGPFAPGASPESGGAPEIEIEFSGGFALGTVVGTRRADEFQWGPGGAHAGLNLNPGDAGDQDVDVTARGLAFLSAHGGAGNDMIGPGPAAALVRGEHFSHGGPGDDRLIAPRDTDGTLEGGPGSDMLTGGGVPDFLRGGAGDDSVAGGGGDDLINGGQGRDLLSGGRGRDSIESRDRLRDRVSCGPGRDRVHADRRDRLRACEVKGRVRVPL
jgi:RTX calcium-binding nonapeptide repeat (4 copies)